MWEAQKPIHEQSLLGKASVVGVEAGGAHGKYVLTCSCTRSEVSCDAQAQQHLYVHLQVHSIHDDQHGRRRVGRLPEPMASCLRPEHACGRWTLKGDMP